MTFLFVTVNYKTAGLTVEALRSLAPEMARLPGSRAIVVDNCSQDQSCEVLSEAIRSEGWSAWARVEAAPRNGGFSYGNNAAIRLARQEATPFDAVFLLNPDAQIRPGTPAVVEQFLRDHPRAGIAGVSILNGEGEPEPSAHRFPSALNELNEGAQFGPLSKLLRNHLITPDIADRSHPCDWVSGAGMVIRREVLEEIGLFDEGYFLYFEEVDLCRRAKSAGWEVWYLPEAGIVHLEGASTGITATRKRRASYWYDSRRRYFAKHRGRTGLILADLAFLITRSALLLRRTLRLGGRAGIEKEPLHWLGDTIAGDFRALWGPSLRREHLVNRY